MRTLLLVNPAATTTTPRTREVIVRALAGDLEVEVVTTQHRGHAQQLARQARRDGLDAVLTLGGDGTVNEVINGLLQDGIGDDVPVLGAVPGGSANVFVRALGLPAEPVEATGALLEAMGEKRTRTIGLGTAEYGFPAPVVRVQQRHRHRRGDHRLDGAAALARRHRDAGSLPRDDDRPVLHPHRPPLPALTVRRPGVAAVPACTSRSSRTRRRGRSSAGPARPLPRASFDTGIDMFAATSMAVLPSLRHVRRMVLRSGTASRSGLLALHDQAELVIEAERPLPLQVDGDSCGLVGAVRLRSVPGALRVFC